MNKELIDRVMDAISPLTREELEQFISTQPLYARLRRPLPEWMFFISPRVVFVTCDICKVNRPFRAQGKKMAQATRYNHVQGDGPLDGMKANASGVYDFYFTCSGCDREYVTLIEVDYENSVIRKVGQNIPWSIDIDKDLEKELGEDAELYKKALVLISQSYGIGACAYLRRIVENQISPMLNILYEIRRNEGANEDELNQIRATIQNKNFTPRIELASELLPESIIVEGTNPIKLLHDQFSKSIHALTDEEAINIAVTLRNAFEYVMIQLNQRQRARKQFVEGIRNFKAK